MRPVLRGKIVAPWRSPALQLHRLPPYMGSLENHVFVDSPANSVCRAAQKLELTMNLNIDAAGRPPNIDGCGDAQKVMGATPP